MKITILASIIVGSTAFAPSQQVVRSSSSLAAESNAGYASEPGVIAPLGLYDPCALLYGADQERFEHLRAVELKHGRVSMLAVVGYLVTYGMYPQNIMFIFCTYFIHLSCNNVNYSNSSWISQIYPSLVLISFAKNHKNNAIFMPIKMKF